MATVPGLQVLGTVESFLSSLCLIFSVGLLLQLKEGTKSESSHRGFIAGNTEAINRNVAIYFSLSITKLLELEGLLSTKGSGSLKFHDLSFCLLCKLPFSPVLLRT